MAAAAAMKTSGSTGHQCDDFGHPATNQGGNANFEKQEHHMF